MTQPLLNFDRDCSLPISGRSPRARHSSASGAQVALRTRGRLALEYRALLIEAGPQSDYEAARVLGRLVSSICSTRNAWGERVVPSDQVEKTSFGTSRTRWRWVER